MTVAVTYPSPQEAGYAAEIVSRASGSVVARSTGNTRRSARIAAWQARIRAEQDRRPPARRQHQT